MYARFFSCLIVLLAMCGVSFADDSLRKRLEDVPPERTDAWVYNDIKQATAAAKQRSQPLFVTFRCVPCKACAAFDADVVSGNERICALARDRFVAVRQVEMKGVDLSLFQFDYDLNWAALFLNPDGTVYARYGTQSSEGPDAYNSVDGLLQTMNRVLELHDQYPGNLDELKGKRGEAKPVTSVLELPGLRNRERYAEQTTRLNCVHCHNVHDAEHQQALDRGQYSARMMWKYPLPENIGLKIDRRSGIQIQDVTPGSGAAKAGIQANDEIVRMNGQWIASIADMQWVLHHLSGDEAQVHIETRRAGVFTVKLAPDWKRIDFSWRASMWNAPPRFQAWAPELADVDRQKLGIPDTDKALEVRWINRPSAGGQRAYDDGLREHDVIIAVGGKPLRLNTRQFNVYLKEHFKVGEVLPLTVLRKGDRAELKIRLIE